MDVKEHYDKHLGNFYAWMCGDFRTLVSRFRELLNSQGIRPRAGGIAIDAGAGHGAQSVALAEAGFTVQAIDFSNSLLTELRRHAETRDIHVYNDTILNISHYCKPAPELIVCWGDTLTHLNSTGEVVSFLEQCCNLVSAGGHLIISFRDYSHALKGNERFIPVKSDDKRILTCFLEFDDTFVRVTDLLYEKHGSDWQQKISSYNKVRVPPLLVTDLLKNSGMTIRSQQQQNGMISIIAEKTR